MAVTEIRLRKVRKAGAKTEHKDRETTAELTYRVLCSSSSDTANTAVAAVEALYSSFGSLTARQYDGDEVEDSAPSAPIYDVTVHYSDKVDTEDDPTELTVRFGFSTYEEDVYQELDDEPTAVDAAEATITVGPTWKWGDTVCNSAGQKFDPSIRKTYYLPTIVLERLKDDFDYSTWLDYIDAVNSDTFTISYKGHTYSIPEGQARLADWSVEVVVRENAYKFQHHYEIQINPNGWKVNVLDEGLMQLTDDDKHKPILDKNNDPILYKGLLDGKGKTLPSTDTPVFLQFRLHETRAFGSLSF